jgi:hypothetical protein
MEDATRVLPVALLTEVVREPAGLISGLHTLSRVRALLRYPRSVQAPSLLWAPVRPT